MAEKTESAAKKAPAKKSISKGQVMGCEICGFEVTVNEVCGCAETHEIFCCNQPMKEKPAKAAKK
jgi:hypothetical protein